MRGRSSQVAVAAAILSAAVLTVSPAAGRTVAPPDGKPSVRGTTVRETGSVRQQSGPVCAQSRKKLWVAADGWVVRRVTRCG
jgi:hypothetical protein